MCTSCFSGDPCLVPEPAFPRSLDTNAHSPHPPPATARRPGRRRWTRRRQQVRRRRLFQSVSWFDTPSRAARAAAVRPQRSGCGLMRQDFALICRTMAERGGVRHLQAQGISPSGQSLGGIGFRGASPEAATSRRRTKARPDARSRRAVVLRAVVSESVRDRRPRRRAGGRGRRR